MSKALNKKEFRWHHKTERSFQCARMTQPILASNLALAFTNILKILSSFFVGFICEIGSFVTCSPSKEGIDGGLLTENKHRRMPRWISVTKPIKTTMKDRLSTTMLLKIYLVNMLGTVALRLNQVSTVVPTFEIGYESLIGHWQRIKRLILYQNIDLVSL